MTSMVAPIDTTREDILRSLEARATALEQGAEPHPRDVIIYRELRVMSDEQADQFRDRLQSLLDEFEATEIDEAGAGAHTRALTVAFYPSFYYEEPEIEAQE